MCGIAGKLSFDRSRPVDPALVSGMTDTLRHRGPDDGGVWTAGRIGLGNRRLAVIDLSPLGHQPMANEDGSLVIAFNGEIYNFRELRQRVEASGHRSRSKTDTEVILHLYEDEGVECLRHLRGMFAFAIWDARRQRLFLARDRFGKKPLYYARTANALTFASEADALLADPDLAREPDPAAIDAYLAFGYVPGDTCAFRGIEKLPPAHYLLADEGRVSAHRYWDLDYEPKTAAPEDALVDELRTTLNEAVRLRMISDVPVGVLLSGGVDSSAVVAAARACTSGPLRTFSIGFGRPDYDEREYARAVARRFETAHEELVVEPDPVSSLADVAAAYSEPFADSSAVATLAVCRLARESVTVALGGDGGDETWLGYDRYRASRLAARMDLAPMALRQMAAGAARVLPNPSPKSALGRVRRFGETLTTPAVRRYATWMTCFDAASRSALYTADLMARVGHADPLARFDAAVAAAHASDPLERLVYADVRLYLPDDLLVKVDIASMHYGLEVRAPLLDHVLAEFAARVPASLKLRGGTQKYLLKRAMRGLLPDAVLDRPKMGFGVPIEHWLRGPLRETAYDVLLDSRARDRGYFRSDAVRRLLDEHMAGRVSRHFQIWALLLLELWHRSFIDARSASAAARVPAGVRPC